MLPCNAESPLAYASTIRQDFLMVEMSEALLDEVCSSGCASLRQCLLPSTTRD